MPRWTLLLCMVCPPILHAAGTDTGASTSAWKGEGELGFSSTSGNSDSENLNASLGLSSEADNWKHSVTLKSLKAKTDGETSADRLEFRERSEYGLSERSYLYGQLRYEDDEFSGYDYQVAATVGAGSRLLASGRHLLDTSAGLGVRQVKSSADGKTDAEAIVGADLGYEYTISESAALSERLLLERGEQNTYAESETALRTRINGALSAKVSYLVKHNSEVPPGIENTDRLVTVSLVYGF
ncbi:MAG TPA: DUF481 domain-containing protein [Gammaproteobacteria bacterium]|nr:DUF481 domain-containing protein [Gammaproteobacteria bacterium]